jgi:hypothetical protein
MSHVDEGQLHEYLDRLERPTRAEAPATADGPQWQQVEAHLAACEACRRRLDEVRQLRRQAAAVLHGSGPAQIDHPPFEALVARSSAQQTRRRVLTVNRLTAVGWAATVVLAVGVGWIARGSLSFGERQPVTPSQPAATVALEAEEANRIAGGVAARSEIAAEDTPATVPGPEGRGAREARRSVAAAEPSPEAKAQDPMAGRLAPAEVERPNIPAQAPPAAAEPAIANEVSGVVQIAADSAAVAPRELDALERRARVDVGEALQEQQRVAALRQLQQSFAGVTWQDAGREEAERHLGGRLALVDDLAVLRISLGTVAGTEAVRTEQTLPSGDTLEIVQWRQEEGVPSVAELGDYRQQVGDRDTPPVRQMVAEARDGYLLILRARTLADSLQALLRRIP